jgi:hypothetical protein
MISSRLRFAPLWNGLAARSAASITHARGELERVVDPEECIHVIGQRDNTADQA